MTDSADTDRLPDRLDGIDVAQGLKRMSGNVGLYRQIAATVVDEYADAAARASAAVADGTADGRTVRLVHTVKGLLGSLGAVAAQSAAQTLEAALKAGVPARKEAAAFAGAFAAARAALETVRPGVAASAVPTSPGGGNGPCVLVVDDRAANIDMLAAALGDGYAVARATSGAQALALARGAPSPDLVLLDVMMPDMDGHEVCRRLKADPATRDIPVIFVTAKDDTTDETQGFALGAVDYIAKPIAPEIVRARVRTHVALRHAKADLEARNRELSEAITAREDMERVMRHDLKGPLNAIVGLPEVLLHGGGLDERTVRMVRAIRDAGNRMLGMIDLSLDLARMEKGSYVLRATALDVVAVLDGVRADLDNLLSGRDVRLAVHVDDGAGPVMALGDEVLVRTLLANLVKNAVEASPEGGRVDVAVGAGNPVRIGITNQGEVPDTIRARFFEKYVTSGKSGGTGLGTYSARLMAEAQGGTVDLDASVPGATTLGVTLPAASPRPGPANE